MRAEERRESILVAAEQTFARLGYRGAGMADIAAAAGITQPMLYRHFTSKHQLFITCLERSTDLVLAAWREVPDLPTMGKCYLTLSAAGLDAVRLRMQAMAESDDPEIRVQVLRTFQMFRARIQEMVEQEQAADRLAEGVHPAEATWLFFALGLLIDFWLILDPPTAGEAIAKAGELFGRAAYRQGS